MLIAQNQLWIIRARHKVEAQRQLAGPHLTGMLPSELELRAISERWEIEYRDLPASQPRLIEDGRRLLLFRDQTASSDAQAVLRTWLLGQARRRLRPWLSRISRETSLGISGSSVRLQRTRWASCSARGMISLNAALLFLPPELVEYTMLHELCHTLHMDHSRRFWTALKRYDPQYLAHQDALQAAWRLVPACFSG